MALGLLGPYQGRNLEAGVNGKGAILFKDCVAEEKEDVDIGVNKKVCSVNLLRSSIIGVYDNFVFSYINVHRLR